MCMEGKEHLWKEVNGTNYTGFVCNGAYAEKFVGKEFNCYLLPYIVSDIDGGCIDPLMVAYHSIHKSGINFSIKFWSSELG